MTRLSLFVALALVAVATASALHVTKAEHSSSSSSSSSSSTTHHHKSSSTSSSVSTSTSTSSSHSKTHVSKKADGSTHVHAFKGNHHALTHTKTTTRDLVVKAARIVHRWVPVRKVMKCDHYPVDMVVLLDRSGSTKDHAKMFEFSKRMAANVHASRGSQITQLVFATHVKSEAEARAAGKSLETVDVGRTTHLFKAFKRAVAELVALQRKSAGRNHPVLFWATDLWHTGPQCRRSSTTGKRRCTRSSSETRKALAAQLLADLKKHGLEQDVEMFGAQKMKKKLLSKGTKETFEYVRDNCKNDQITSTKQFERCRVEFSRFRYEHSKQAYDARHFLSADVQDDPSECVKIKGEKHPPCKCEKVENDDGGDDYYIYTDHLILFDWNDPQKTADEIIDKMCVAIATVYQKIKTVEFFHIKVKHTQVEQKKVSTNSMAFYYDASCTCWRATSYAKKLGFEKGAMVSKKVVDEKCKTCSRYYYDERVKRWRCRKSGKFVSAAVATTYIFEFFAQIEKKVAKVKAVPPKVAKIEAVKSTMTTSKVKKIIGSAEVKKADKKAEAKAEAKKAEPKKKEPVCSQTDVNKFTTLKLSQLSATRAAMVEEQLAGKCTENIWDISASELAAHWSKASAQDFIKHALGEHFANGMRCGPRVGALKMGWSLAAAGVCIEPIHKWFCSKKTGMAFHGYPECGIRNNDKSSRYRISKSGKPSAKGVASLWGLEPLRAAIVHQWQRAPKEYAAQFYYVKRDNKSPVPAQIVNGLKWRLPRGARPASAENWQVLENTKTMIDKMQGRSGILIGDDCGAAFDPKAKASGSLGLWLNNGVVHALPVNIGLCHRFWFFPMRCDDKVDEASDAGEEDGDGEQQAGSDDDSESDSESDSETDEEVDHVAKISNIFEKKHDKAMVLEKIVPLVQKRQMCAAHAQVRYAFPAMRCICPYMEARGELLAYLEELCKENGEESQEEQQQQQQQQHKGVTAFAEDSQDAEDDDDDELATSL